MFLLRVRRGSVGGGKRTDFFVGVVGVVVCFVVLNSFVVVDGRHISLKKLHRPRGERITEDSVTVEAVPPTTLDSSTTLLRAGYASHLRQNLKKAFALQLLHQAQQRNTNKNHSPTSDEFISRKTKKLKKIKKNQQNSSKFRAHIPFLPFDDDEDDETSGENDESSDDGGFDDEHNFASFDLAVTHPEEDPHFYQERYKTDGGGNKIGDKAPYSLANSYFDNEYPLSQLQAMECATPTKSKGYCSTFRACVPSLFNAEGDLETPALAELVSMSIGYCTSAVRSDLDVTNQFLKRKGHRFATVANRIICCPGVPPPPETSAEDSSAEKFNDFLGGSDSFLEPDEDNVPLEGVSSPPNKVPGTKKKPGNGTNPGIFVDLKGEFVEENPDTEAEVWHSEEDLKAAMNKKPENVIPIEALIPEDKLPFYDPHTNSFSNQILDKFGDKNGQNLPNNGQNSQNSGQNSQNNGQNSLNNGQNSQNNGQNSPSNTENSQNNAENSQNKDSHDSSPPPPPITEPNDEFMPEGSSDTESSTGSNGFIPPHDDGIMSSNDPPDFEGQPISDELTTTVRSSSPGENSTFIEIFPKPVNGANGKFTLEKGVHVQPAAANSKIPAQTSVNNFAENVVDSNKILLVRPTKNKPQPDENSSQKVEIFVQQTTQTDFPDEINTLQNLHNDDNLHNYDDNDDATRTTTDLYNKYHHAEVDDTSTTTRFVADFPTTTPNYGEIDATNGAGKISHSDNHHNYENEDVGNYLADTITTTVPQGGNQNNNSPVPLGENSADFPPQTTTRYYITNNVDENGYTPTEEIDGSKEATLGYLDDEQSQKFPETTTPIFTSGGESGIGEGTTFISLVNDGESEIGHDIPEDIRSKEPPYNLNDHVTGNENGIGDEQNHHLFPSITEKNKEPQQNLNDHVEDKNLPQNLNEHVTGNENGIDNQQLFPVDAATLSPQNNENSLDNGPPSVFSSEKPISGPEVNTGSQEMTGGSAEPSKEGETLEEGNQSISNESNVSDEGVKQFETPKISVSKGPQIKNNPVKHPPPIPTPSQEPEFGGATIVGGSRPFCSGSLITDRHILTASHFVSNITVADVFHMRVHIGYKTAFGGQTEGPFAVRKVLKLNDVAILLLDRPVRFSEDIHPVCLSNNPTLNANGIAEAFETGWVEDPMVKTISSHHPFVDPHVQKYFSFGYNNVTWTLQQSMARVKTNDDCQSNYEFLEKSGIYITDSMLCAATEDGKSCSFKGNSGAPLFIMRDGKPIQLGLVSWGIGCGHFPAVFTSTQKYLPWIEKVVQKTR
ncbi:Serine protease 41 [Folsomia candida]|uniref:Serine protease 41 n=1 Tax=Folsomia candida TaxID=158441 RepID=A0A226DBP0_FOLCA|nr:Serine protease 41 [Folsomia candida]